jgi:SAM-dependent methyltransferase
MEEDSHRHSASAGSDIDWSDSYTGELADYEPPDSDILEIIDSLAPGRALDVGCGAGGILVALAERGWQVTGLEITARAIESAGKVLEDRGADAELIHADAAVWRPDKYFDLITSSFALPDRPSRAEVLQMIRGALSPGGSAVIKDFDSSMTRHGFFAEFDLPALEELTAAFDGFELVRAEVVDTPVHHHGSESSELADDWTAALLHARAPGQAGK